MKNELTTVVMTGGTSGFGKITTERLLNNNVKLLLGARKNVYFKGVSSIPLDLEDLNTIQAFIYTIIKEIGKTKIDALVLNAGVSYANAENRSKEGWETTFAVNHLAHYLIVRSLSAYINDTGVVVFTTSGTHNPTEKTIIPPPKHANAQLLAYPDKDPKKFENPKKAGGHAYSSSKLCNILTARALIANNDNHFQVIAYDPGPVPGTGLSRNNSFLVNTIWKTLSIPFFRQLIPKFNSKQMAGDTLAEIALGNIKPPKGKFYTALCKSKITFPEPSELALNDKVMIKLWNDSAALLGLPTEKIKS